MIILYRINTYNRIKDKYIFKTLTPTKTCFLIRIEKGFAQEISLPLSKQKPDIVKPFSHAKQNIKCGRSSTLGLGKHWRNSIINNS